MSGGPIQTFRPGAVYPAGTIILDARNAQAIARVLLLARRHFTAEWTAEAEDALLTCELAIKCSRSRQIPPTVPEKVPPTVPEKFRSGIVEVAEVARLAGVSESFVRRALRYREIDGENEGGKWLIEDNERVRQWIQARRDRKGTPPGALAADASSVSAPIPTQTGGLGQPTPRADDSMTSQGVA